MSHRDDGRAPVIRRLGIGTLRVLAQLAQHVFEVFLMVLALLTGIGGLAQPDPVVAGAVEPALPTWGRIVWFGGLVVGAVITLAGIGMPLVPRGGDVEQCGLGVLISSALSYVLLCLGSGAVAQALGVSMFVLVLVVRIVWLRWEPKALVAAVRMIQQAELPDPGTDGEGER